MIADQDVFLGQTIHLRRQGNSLESHHLYFNHEIQYFYGIRLQKKLVNPVCSPCSKSTVTLEAFIDPTPNSILEVMILLIAVKIAFLSYFQP